MQWLVEQLLKLILGTGISGIAWVLLVASMGYSIPFWVIWVVCVLLVFGVVFLLEHGGDWDIF